MHKDAAFINISFLFRDLKFGGEEMESFDDDM